MRAQTAIRLLCLAGSLAAFAWYLRLSTRAAEISAVARTNGSAQPQPAGAPATT